MIDLIDVLRAELSADSTVKYEVQHRKTGQRQYLVGRAIDEQYTAIEVGNDVDANWAIYPDAPEGQYTLLPQSYEKLCAVALDKTIHADLKPLIRAVGELIAMHGQTFITFYVLKHYTLAERDRSAVIAVVKKDDWESRSGNELRITGYMAGNDYHSRNEVRYVEKHSVALWRYKEVEVGSKWIETINQLITKQNAQ